MVREPFITVSVANCEGRLQKRWGMKREEGVRREGRHEKRDWEAARGRENKRCGASKECCAFNQSHPSQCTVRRTVPVA